MLRPFEILQPESLDSACAYLSEYGSDAAVYAGGTELLLLMKEGLVHYPRLVDLKRLPKLSEIALDDQRIHIGALATHRAIERSPIIVDNAPVLAHVESLVANVRVRAAGTIGGNLCFGEPHSDPATLLLAWGAELELVSSNGARVLPAEDFFLGLFETARQPHEILTRVSLSRLPEDSQAAYQKFSVHERPTATLAVVVAMSGSTIRHARLAAGSVGPRPVRLQQAEALLQGETASPALFHETGQMAAREVDPVDDLYGSAEYKRHLVAVLTARALEQAAARGLRREHRRD